MEIRIQRRGEAVRHQEITKLVTTVGFGQDCDVMLAAQDKTERWGMLIQQGEGMSFRPLMSPSQVTIDGVDTHELMELPEGSSLTILDYSISWSLQKNDAAYEPWSPPVLPAASVGSGRGYRAGALNAYGNAQRRANTTEEGAELRLSSEAINHQSLSGNTEPQMGSAEAELLKKLELAKRQSSPDTIADDESFWDSGPQEGEMESQNDHWGEVPNTETTAMKPFMKEEALGMGKDDPSGVKNDPVVNGMTMVHRSGKEEDVHKYFFNHLDFDVFTKNVAERRRAMLEGLKEAMAVVLDGQTSSSQVFEQALKSPQPIKDLMMDEGVLGLMIRDKGLLYVDRGKGFVDAEHRFLNAAHAYWVLDRLFLGAGIKMDWQGGQRSFSLDDSWGGRVILPSADWQGAYAIMGRRSAERTRFEMTKSQRLLLAEKVMRRENILVVAENPEVLQQLGYWLVKQSEGLGNVLILSKSEPVAAPDSPRRIGVHRGDEPLVQWLDWSYGIDIIGTLHRDPASPVFDLVRQLAHQAHGWWQLQMANASSLALERLALDMALEQPDRDMELLRELLRSAFGAVLSVTGPSVGEKKFVLELKEMRPTENSQWFIQDRNA